MSETKDTLLGALMGLTRAAEGNEDLLTPDTNSLIAEGLLTASPDRKTSPEALQSLTQRIRREKFRIVPNCEFCASPCGNTSDYDMGRLYGAPEAVRQVKERILQGLFRLAEHPNPEIFAFFYKALSSLTYDLSPEDFAPLTGELKRLEESENGLKTAPMI